MSIVLHHHTGLGDHFICNGLVHALAEKHGGVDLITKRPLFYTIEHLYSDWDNIVIVPVDDEMSDSEAYARRTNKLLHRVGFQHCDFNNFETSFYAQCELDPVQEYDNFKLPSNLSGSKKFYDKIKEKLGKDYIFVHSVSSYKAFDLKIDSTLPRHTVDKSDTDDILDYVDTICNAKEVHVINSGLNNLVFQLYYKDMTKGDIYYHNARKLEDGGIPIKIPEGVKVIQYE